MNMHEMGTLFDMERLSATILEDLHCLVADKPAFEGMVRDEKVVLMDEHVRRENPKYLRVKEGRAIDVLYKGMRLSEELSTLYLEPCLAKISQALGGAESYLTIHMRVEDDFTESCHFPPSKRSKKPVPRPCMYSAKRIADAVRLTRELRDYRHVFMIYAADRLNQKHAVKVYGKQPDPTEVWPAGVVATHPGHLHCFDNATLTYTERSVVNMFLAAASPGPFLGTPFSSLGMGVSLLRYHQGAVSYLYNCQSAKFRSAALYKRDAKNPSTGQIRC